MLVLITYDVATEVEGGRARLRKIADTCTDYGQRVQNSVFECDVDWSEYLTLKSELLGIINNKTDSLRFYNLGNKYKSKIESFGAKKTYDPEGILML